MAAIVFLALFLAIFGVSDATWCVCRTDMSNAALQKTIDYACGAGADCNPILKNGACYDPNTVLAHCSYAANSYFQRKGQAQGSCDFTSTATISQTDPSGNGCAYPATPGTAGTAGAGTGASAQNPGSSSTGSMTPTSTGTGVLGGLGPTSIDGSGAAAPFLLATSSVCLLVISFFLPGLIWLRL